METYLVTIYINHPIIDVLEQKRISASVFLSFHILQIVGVNNSYNKAELKLPSFTMMVPRKMFGFLKDRNIRFFIRNALCYIPKSKNTSFTS
ncbi:hypothetical protein HanRHA438_Chr06g0254871 [Helianthus annuus]|nr:hypothetical protein HanRHA438_Chr06g0254871 [Helianthus annuus]